MYQDDQGDGRPGLTIGQRPVSSGHKAKTAISPEQNEILLDPAAPRADEETLDAFEFARNLANFGASGMQSFPEDAPLVAPTLNIDWKKAITFLLACKTSTPRVSYKLGAKISSDAAVPGKDFKAVDCSGFVRATIRRSTDPKAALFPDGSVVQHDWVKAKGFAKSTVADGSLRDGKIRIAFLDPWDTRSGIGHVALVQNGQTAESHGGVGPESRTFDGTGWQATTKLYILQS